MRLKVPSDEHSCSNVSFYDRWDLTKRWQDMPFPYFSEEAGKHVFGVDAVMKAVLSGQHKQANDASRPRQSQCNEARWSWREEVRWNDETSASAKWDGPASMRFNPCMKMLVPIAARNNE
jgi:hypothetical protein